MDDKKVKYDALDAMWAFVRMGGYQLHPADVITNNIVIGAMVLYMSGSLDALTPKEASHHEKERN